MKRRLRESVTVNPNSENAYYEKDVSGPENEDVHINDGKIHFVWNRGKSNENISNTGDGKGFSFYLARHVYKDPNVLYIDCSEGNTDNEDRTRVVGIIPGDEKTMSVIDIVNEDNNSKRIISANYVDASSKWAKNTMIENICVKKVKFQLKNTKN
jgi:uncharacterized DUF497 family protein